MNNLGPTPTVSDPVLQSWLYRLSKLMVNAASKSVDVSDITGTFAADADLIVSVDADKYTFEVFLSFYETTLGTGGFKFDLSSGTAPVSEILWSASGFDVAGVSTAANVSASTSQSYGTVSTSASAPSWIRVTGQVTFTDSGTFGVRWAQNSASANPTFLKEHSFLSLQKVS